MKKDVNLKKGKKERYNQRGITLVALVITTVILIILATIAVQYAFGENGVIKKAELAKNIQANAEAYEQEEIENAEDYIDQYKPFEPKPTPEPPTGGKEMADMTNGVIEIKWLSGTSNNVADAPNAPVTKNISNGTMELVKFDSESKTWVPGSDYNYMAGTGSSDNTESKWANARVTIDGVDSYFVWIPRYAYRIIYFDSAESKKAYQEGTLTEKDAVAEGKIIGYSDSRGIVDASGKKIDSVASTTKTMVSKDYFMVHPAFINDVNVGGWDSEIPGIWVGKYETSGTTSQLKVEPGVESLDNTSIGDSYTCSKAYQTELESHMLKNSEWGAIAYLAESKYGRNGTKIAKNRSRIAGAGETSTDYTSEDGKKASSTGNVFGVYDLSGGLNEYVAAYYNGSTSSNLTNSGGSFASQGGISTKYATAYTDIYVSTAYKYGDGTYEISKTQNFLNSDLPFFLRGGYFDMSSGIFSYNNNHRYG